MAKTAAELRRYRNWFAIGLLLSAGALAGTLWFMGHTYYEAPQPRPEPAHSSSPLETDEPARPDYPEPVETPPEDYGEPRVIPGELSWRVEPVQVIFVRGDDNQVVYPALDRASLESTKRWQRWEREKNKSALEVEASYRRSLNALGSFFEDHREANEPLAQEQVMRALNELDRSREKQMERVSPVRSPPGDTPSNASPETTVGPKVLFVTSIATSVTSLMGFAFTWVFAWRKERREDALAKVELELKTKELERVRRESDALAASQQQPAERTQPAHPHGGEGSSPPRL